MTLWGSLGWSWIIFEFINSNWVDQGDSHVGIGGDGCLDGLQNLWPSILLQSLESQVDFVFQLLVSHVLYYRGHQALHARI